MLVVQNGSVDMVYLDDRAAADRFAEAQGRCAPRRSPRSGVDEALYREPNPLDGGIAHTLDSVHPGWRIAGPRTGDLFVTHNAGGAFNEPNPLTGNHGSPQTSDNMFAVVSGGPLVRQQALGGHRRAALRRHAAQPGQAQNVDVAPTAMALLRRSAPPTARAAS